MFSQLGRHEASSLIFAYPAGDLDDLGDSLTQLILHSDLIIPLASLDHSLHVD